MGFPARFCKLWDIAGATWEEYSSDDSLQDRAERNLQTAAQIASIGNYVIAINGFRSPESYSEIFVILQEEDIISDELAETFQKIAGFRNILVHDYLEIDQKIVFDCLQRLDDFRAFVQKNHPFAIPFPWRVVGCPFLTSVTGVLDEPPECHTPG